MESTSPGAGPATLPAEICGYPIDCALKGQETYLAIGPGGRGVVLKKLDPDCLLRGVLHPSIRERLCRVRELAQGGVANLHGVGREAEQAYLIWEFVPGEPFDAYVSASNRSPRDLLVLARELILSVESLHAQGIVHGAINGGNIIVSPDNAVRLTHVSPLLYADPLADVESVIALLGKALERRGEQDSPLARTLIEAAQGQTSLRALAAKVAALMEARDDRPEPHGAADDRPLRRRMLVAAALIALLGAAIAYAVWRQVESGGGFNNALPWTTAPAGG